VKVDFGDCPSWIGGDSPPKHYAAPGLVAGPERSLEGKGLRRNLELAADDALERGFEPEPADGLAWVVEAEIVGSDPRSGSRLGHLDGRARGKTLEGHGSPFDDETLRRSPPEHPAAGVGGQCDSKAVESRRLDRIDEEAVEVRLRSALEYRFQQLHRRFDARGPEVRSPQSKRLGGHSQRRGSHDASVEAKRTLDNSGSRARRPGCGDQQRCR
jgi:hypothetical protein